MSTRRRVLRNSGYNLIAGISQRIGQTVTFILVAWMLTPEALGSYKLAITYTSILLTLSLWGLDQLLVRDVSKDKTKVGLYLGNYMALRLALATVFWLGIVLVSPYLPYAPETKQFIVIMTASIIPASISNLFQAVWASFEDMKSYTVVLLIFSVVRIVGGVAVLLNIAVLMPIAAIFLLASIAEMLTNGWILSRRPFVRQSIWKWDWRFARHSLKIATPLIAVSFILIVEYQFDDVILSFFWPEEVVGVYGTAAMIFTLLLFIPRSIQLALFPVISRAYHNQSNLQAVYSQSMKFLIVLTFPIALFVSLFSSQIIEFVFGSVYEEAGPILAVLAWAFFIAALNVPNSRLLISANKQRMVAVFALFSMVGNILLSLWLVPRFGGLGTAWARVLAMPLYTIPALVYVQRYICRLDWREFFRLDMAYLRPGAGKGL
ncbi:MAG: flippase [Chloroflexi bacterium]|nr:flippase [Chloroflexota bacterium]